MNQNQQVTIEENVNQENQQNKGMHGKKGIWFFILAELILFCSLFLIYTLYKVTYSAEFSIAALNIKTNIGFLSTVIILTSSLTVALSVMAIQKKNEFLALIMVFMTIIFGKIFIITKIVEWLGYFDNGLYSGSEQLLDKAEAHSIFYNLYYWITGFNCFYIVIGILFFASVALAMINKKINFTSYKKLEKAGLLWHSVVVIWIFIFPIFYLIR